jgi:hypothetical protein
LRKKERKKIFQAYLESLIYEGGTNNIAVFTETSSKKFLQFVGSNGDRMIMLDVPFVALDKSERKMLLETIVILEKADVSYQVLVTPEQGALIAEQIFLDVFFVSNSYSFETELTLE